MTAPMSGQTRHSGRLLRTVAGKPHATQADHHDVLPTPPATNSARSSGSQRRVSEDEEDINRSPESSEDERPAVYRQALNVGGAQDEPAKPVQIQRARVPAPASPERPRAQWKSATKVRSPESTRSKRSNESEEQGSSDGDNAIFSSQGSAFKKPKKDLTNMHAPPPRRQRHMYGKIGQRAKSSSQKKEFQRLSKQENKVEEPAKPQFQRAQAVNDIFEFKGERAQFKSLNDTESGARNSLSPSLSSLSSPPESPGVEEVEQLNLPKAAPYCPTENCDICGAKVDRILKENFQDRFTNGKGMTFKWQQRFCRHHKQESAKEWAREKGWPTIDWTCLPQRMTQFDDHLRDVICNRVESRWKNDLRRHLRPSKSRFLEVRAAADAREVKTMARTGYYGPRGEKVMTEHIVANLSDDLRERASKDKIVAASGVKGGMSGFVHGVLVPEMACQLIAEDLGCDPDYCRIVVGESSIVGDLLNPDVEEDVVRGRGEGSEDDMEETEGSRLLSMGW